MNEQPGNSTAPGSADSSVPAAVSGASSQPARRAASAARYWWYALAALALIVGGLPWLRTRQGAAHANAEGQTPAASAMARDVPYLDGGLIRYSAAFAERNQLKAEAVERGMLSPVVHVTGTVSFDPDKVAAIGARITGRVRNVFKLEGAVVKPADVLAEIESAELGEAQAALLAARAHAQAALANERREKALAESKIASEREAELAAANAASASAELRAAEGKVRAMGGSPQGEPGILQLRSPIHGRVVDRNLWRGQFVEPTLTAFKVADLSSVFVELAVFERDVTTIRAGDPVEISAPGSSKSLVTGSVAYVGDEIDLQTKTARVRVVAQQPATPLRPGQSVLASIHTSAKADPVLVLPREAVTSVDGKPTVFVARDEHAVEPRAIELGRQDGKQVEVLSGLTDSESVMVSGVFALKSEIFR